MPTEKSESYLGEWGHLKDEPCRYCHQVGGVYFLIDEGIKGISPVRCDKCGRDWDNDSPLA